MHASTVRRAAARHGPLISASLVRVRWLPAAGVMCRASQLCWVLLVAGACLDQGSAPAEQPELRGKGDRVLFGSCLEPNGTPRCGGQGYGSCCMSTNRG